MRLTDDLTSSKAILLKGWLFLAVAILGSALLLLIVPRWDVVALVAITVWSSCRFYYFMFYVITRYIDPDYRFAGLGSAIRYSFRMQMGRRT